MIALFTDYGYEGPYVGQLHSAIEQFAPGIKAIDLMHDAPIFNPKASAYLLPPLISSLPIGTVICCVVDPGVGSERLACLVEADGYYFVGPDNGLFTIIAQRAKKILWHTIMWRPEKLSNTFHGRDLFAPVAAMLANGTRPEVKHVDVQNKISEYDWSEVYPTLIYIDRFGNVMTGITGDRLSDSAVLRVGGSTFHYASHFAAVTQGQLFWYRNSLGLVEFAVNSGRADKLPDMKLGNNVEIINQ